MPALPILSGTTDLYQYAQHMYSAARVQRYLLFKLPAFIRVFRALPFADQQSLWAQLRVSRKNHNHRSDDVRVVATFTPQPVVEEWFLEFCRSPSTFDFDAHIWRVGQCCPELWLREQFAERMEAVKVTQLPPIKAYHAARKDGSVNQRKRTSWQGTLSPDWVHACVLKIVGELTTLDYQDWLGAPDNEARYPLLLVHEKNAQRGVFPKTRAVYALLVHPSSMKPAPLVKAKQRKTKAIINPGRNAQLAAARRDSSARMEANIQADLALIAMGGSLKQLRDAMGARIGHKPRLGSVIAYLKFALQQRHPRMDSRVIGPEYNGLFAHFAYAYEQAPEKFKGMMPELGVLNIGPNTNGWVAGCGMAVRKSLPRT